MRNATLVSGFALFLAGCTGGQEGRGFFIGSTPVVGGTISAFELNYPDDSPIGGGTTDEKGWYKSEVHGAEGDMLVCVTGGIYRDIATSVDADMGSEKLCAIALNVRADAEKMVLHITPATHLAYSKALYLSQTHGLKLGEAYRIATSDINSWLGCGRAGDVVNATPIDAMEPQQTAGVESIRAGLVRGALSFQAKLISEAVGATPGRHVSGKTLLLAYADDLVADGKLDGRGTQGDIYQHGHRLTAGSARGEKNGLAHGLSKYLDSGDNNTGLTFADFREFLACLSTAQGSLFAGTSPSLNAFDVGPEISVATFDAETDRELAENQILRSTVYLDVTALHDHGIKGVTAWLDGDPQPMREANHSSSSTSYHLDTRRLQDGDHWIDIEATSDVVMAKRHQHRFVVDNTRPVIFVLEGHGWTKQGAGVRVAGTVNKGVQTVSASVSGASPSTHAVTDGAFAFTLDVPCNVRSEVLLSVIDPVGNAGEQKFSILCDSTPPTIGWLKSEYAPERIFGMLGVNGKPIFGQVGISEEIEPRAPGIAVFSKYIHLLDYLPEQGLNRRTQNLPSLHLEAADATVDFGVSTAVRVEYRYLIDGEEKRPWSTFPVEDSVYKLPISYQTLHPDVWLSEPVHRIEARAFDPAGNESETLSFDFKMIALLPKLKVSECISDPLMERRNFDHIAGIFNQPQNVDTFSGVVSWEFPVPEGSLMPQHPLEVHLNDWNRPRSHISRISGKITPSHKGALHYVRKWNVCGMQAGLTPGSKNFFENFVTLDGTLTCSSPRLENVHRVCDDNGPVESQRDAMPHTIDCARLKNSTEHNVTYRILSMDGQYVSTGPHFQLSPNESRRVVVALNAPSFGAGPNLYQLRTESKPLTSYQIERELYPPLRFEWWQYGLYAEAMAIKTGTINASGRIPGLPNRSKTTYSDACKNGLTLNFD